MKIYTDTDKFTINRYFFTGNKSSMYLIIIQVFMIKEKENLETRDYYFLCITFNFIYSYR